MNVTRIFPRVENLGLDRETCSLHVVHIYNHVDFEGLCLLFIF